MKLAIDRGNLTGVASDQMVEHLACRGNLRRVFLIYLFIISNMKESELVKKLSLTSMLKVIGGPVMFIVFAYFLSQGHWIELWDLFQL